MSSQKRYPNQRTRGDIGHHLPLSRFVCVSALLYPLLASHGCAQVGSDDLTGLNPQPEPPAAGTTTATGPMGATTTGSTQPTIDFEDPTSSQSNGEENVQSEGTGTGTGPTGSMMSTGTATGATGATGGGGTVTQGAAGAASPGFGGTSASGGAASSAGGAAGAGGEAGTGGIAGMGGVGGEGMGGAAMVSVDRCERYASEQLECFNPLLMIDGVIDPEGEVVGGYFADGSCTEPLGAIQKASGVPTLMTGAMEQPAVQCLFEVGDAYAGQLYTDEGGTCVAVDDSTVVLQTWDVYRVGDAFSGALCGQ